MPERAIFIGPNGEDAASAMRQAVDALSSATVGDLMFVGQGYRARIRERTFQGVDFTGAPFAAYSSKGPYYFYANRSSTSGRTTEGRAARAKAAANRHAKTGRIGVRTATGIRYESYGAMKGALGRGGVDLYGAEQHTHMLDTMLVKCGGAEASMADDLLNAGAPGEFDAFEQNQPANQVVLGFYGPEEERARGNNEGTGKGGVKREFFALNADDLAWGDRMIAERMAIRARRHA